MARPTDFHESLRSLLAFNARDWADDQADAWIYGIVWGWDEEPDSVVLDEGEAPDQVMLDLAKRYRWDDAEVERLRMLHRQFEESARRAEEPTSVGEAAARVDEARAVLQQTVDREREQGKTWAAIGDELGITKQTAWEKFGRGEA